MSSRLVLNAVRSVARSSAVYMTPMRLATTPRLLNLSAVRSFYSTPRVMDQASNVIKELSEFLNKEIELEKENRKHKTGLPTFTGFDLKSDGPNVTLTKNFQDEVITVKFNVNGSLTSGMDNAALDESANQQAQDDEIKARPMFTVEVKRKDQVLSFACDFLPDESGAADNSAGAPEDFQINEFAIHNGGEWNENVYTADCSLLDGQLYDILLNLLDERGIGEKFANELAEFATAYEHTQYIGLLEKLKKFSA